jgi:hypothetical protein
MAFARALEAFLEARSPKRGALWPLLDRDATSEVKTGKRKSFT